MLPGMFEWTDRGGNVRKRRDVARSRAKIGIQSRLDFAAVVHQQGNATVEPVNSNGRRRRAVAQLSGALFDQQRIERVTNGSVRTVSGNRHG